MAATAANLPDVCMTAPSAGMDVDGLPDCEGLTDLHSSIKEYSCGPDRRIPELSGPVPLIGRS
jgi:hypothetical protein